MNKIIISSLILTCFVVFAGFLTINDKLNFMQNQIYYKNKSKDDGIAGYKICVNEYCSGLFRTDKEALKKLKKLQEKIYPYPDNLKFMSYDVVYYEKKEE